VREDSQRQEKMGLFDRLANLLGLRKKEVNVLVVGLNNSGKSTVINNFKREDDRCIDIVPTVGFNIEIYVHYIMRFKLGKTMRLSKFNKFHNTVYIYIHIDRKYTYVFAYIYRI